MIPEAEIWKIPNKLMEESESNRKKIENRKSKLLEKYHNRISS